jgi:predicted dehydrogenase
MEVIQGFEQEVTDQDASVEWQPVSDRKIRGGIAGYRFCGFGAKFYFQDHPNVTVTAVADLDPEKCADLARKCRCRQTVASCEELIEDDSIEAIFVATDAPSHARLAIAALRDGELMKIPQYVL